MPLTTKVAFRRVCEKGWEKGARVVRAARRSPRPSPVWAGAFGAFVATSGDHDSLASRLAGHGQQLELIFRDWVTGAGDSRQLADLLLQLCAAADDGTVWHRDLGLRSYVDASLQAKLLRLFVDRLSSMAPGSTGVGPLALITMVLGHVPDSRVALLVHGDLLLEAGEVDDAIEVAQHLLRIQAVCMTSEALLLRAYRAKRDAGSTAPELEVLDFDLTERFCEIPFTHLSTGVQGNAFACSCPSWVPFPVGNVYQAETPDEVWNSDTAAEIRRSILDGDYRYCSRTQCSFLLARKLPKKSEVTDPILRHYIDDRVTQVAEAPKMFELNHDPTCNLACPSCRLEIITAKADEQDTFALATERVLLPMLKRVQGHAYISGGGEAFASKHYRSVLKALNRAEFPGLDVLLITNGQLLTPVRWSQFPDLPEMIASLLVSIDAARAETYENLRYPGKWSILMRNLDFIAELRRSGQVRSLCLNFVVQRDNFRQMLEFADLGTRVGADQIWFQRLVNYGTYDQATFAELDVASPSHPDHAELLDLLRNPRLRAPANNLHMLLHLLPEYVASEEPVKLWMV